MLNRQALLLLAIVAGIFFVSNAKVNSINPRTETRPGYAPKEYNINLDLPPLERWREIVTDYTPAIQAFKSYVLRSAHLPAFFFNFVSYSYAARRDPEYAEELQAIAQLSGMEFSMMYLVNFVYELTAYCTSTIIRTASGKIIHGRNLDFAFMPYAANLTAQVSFYRGGNLLYKADVTVGSLGILAGVKPGKFAISLNERHKGSLLTNLREYFFQKSMPSLYLVRKAFETANSFDEAISIISTTRIIAPAYYIVSGVQPHEGVIISRNATGVTNAHWLKDNDPDWYIAVSNYDRDEIDPDLDYRRIPAENRIYAIGQQNMTEQLLLDEVLAKFPNLNFMSILSAIMVPSTGYFNTTMWF